MKSDLLQLARTTAIILKRAKPNQERIRIMTEAETKEFGGPAQGNGKPACGASKTSNPRS